MQPQMASPELLEVMKEYAKWWTSKGDYALSVSESDNALIGSETLVSEEAELLIDQFNRSTNLLTADMMGVAMAAIGLDDIEQLKELKESVMDATEKANNS